MIAQLNTSQNIVQENFSIGISKNENAVKRKKEKTVLQIAIIKVRLFVWNLSPVHWYDTFKELHVDMNEFISPKNKHLKK